MKKLVALLIFLVLPFQLIAKNKSLLIFAGAGMREPLNEIGKKFNEHYKIEVIYDYEGSGRLGNKILAGQTPDIFIPGSMRWAKILKNKGYIEKCYPIAYHIPVIITPLKDKKVVKLKDLLKPHVSVVLGNPQACAIGKVSLKIFKKANISWKKLNIVALGVTVKQLVHWIEGNNADASIVWQADAKESGKVRIVQIPEKFNTIAVIPACVVKNPPHPNLVKTYIKFLLTQGKKYFAKYGFKVVK